MNLHLKGKKAIVTGGSAGIGLAIAQLLAEEGVEVTIPGRSAKKIDEILAKLPAEILSSISAVEADLTNAEGVKTLAAAVPETDILVNNLGIYDSKEFGAIDDETWFRYFETNVMSGVRLSRHYFPGMLKRNEGRIVFISSEAGAEIHPDMIHYGVTKTSQLALSRGLAELTKGTKVTVNSVLPGPTRSETVDTYMKEWVGKPDATSEEVEKIFFEKRFPGSLLQRMAENREVASLVAYLASPLAAATNGAVLRAEGGILPTLF
ncbi:NAD(P)-dependent dehydrogenase, short-chain alcohol dehydrogenase family [Verrucomicrobium sp. GAS474]|uniref:SDR family NAD(P)-dependent oxidoreductase n=1 Tax=Verrucomicrobium sp. GAS474 TaxID=1882831 RepID=UPI000879F030|nr:SDR family oxidoreductase [Verrucomicrobium sp. GAS474]SDU29031.1 NAD(P)-dependent dehydrogenase, short-chain alcohol dehydrogenase family [Verrucomicrobium sp. GAS474]